VFNYNIIWDIINVACFRIVQDSFPICLAVALDGAIANLEGAFQSGLFLHAVICSSVWGAFDFLEVDSLVELFELGRSHRVGEVHEELDMACTLFTHFKLPTCVGSL